jgi:hypothetical protein
LRHQDQEREEGSQRSPAHESLGVRR